MLFFKAKKSIGLDIGTHSVKAVQMSRRGGRLCIEEVGYALVDRNQVNADPVVAHAAAIANRRRPEGQQSNGLLLGGALVAILLIFGGIMAIGRPIFGSM